MPVYIVAFLLFFLPFLVLPIGTQIFEPPKVIIAELAILLLFLLSYSRLNLNNISRTKLLILGSFFVITLFQVIFSLNQNSFFGNIFRLQGVFLFWNLLLFSLISSLFSLEKINKYVYLGSLAFLLGSTLFLWKDPSGRFVGTLGEPNALAATSIYILPFIFFNFRKAGKVLGVIVTLMIIYLTVSHSALIALFVMGIFWCLIKFLRMSAAKAFLVAALFIFLSLFLPFLEDNLYESRVEVWETAFAAGLSKPILGWGFGNIQQALFQTSKNLNNNIQYQVVDSSHNFLLDFWVQTGILGLLLALSMIFFSFKSFLDKKNYFNLLMLLGLMTTMLFNPTSVVVLIAFWWVIGQG